MHKQAKYYLIMDNQHLYHELYDVLRMEDRYCTDAGELIKSNIQEDALNLAPSLLKLLLANESLNRHFFRDVDGIRVFDKVAFQKLIMNKQFLPDSYTAYKNKIGLTTDDGRFITDSREVVLAWPYKDCMLEGGQTKEEAKRDEVFWNETLAPDEINRLTEPKMLTNFRRYDKDGEHNVEHLSPNDNLIIKGNNLLALHSLKEKYAGQVKLIYIDPPYYFTKNKDLDSFKYNSNFRLSTWLTFMRNRLVVAKDLLQPGGVIMCHIKEDAIHWLKVLMEETFSVDNFVETFIWKNTDNPDSLSKKSRSSVEYIVCYELPKNTAIQYNGKQTENGDAPILHTGNNIHELTFPAGSIHFNIADGIYEKGKPDRVELITPIEVKNGVNVDNAILKGEFTWSQDNLDLNYKQGCYFLVKSNKFSVRVQLPNAKTMAPEKYIDEQYLSKAIGIGTNEDATTHLKQLGIEFSFSKPESLAAFIIQAITKEDDLVLDFFLGSGTTAAVAMKMRRRFIGIDQMDYIKTVACERLTKVIDGENGGVSKAVNWQGGGSFVYCELSKYNQNFIDEIEEAKTIDELMVIWRRMQETGFLSYQIKAKDINIDADDFKDLSMDDQKRFLIECLDKNLLYIPFSEIDNEEYNISDEDKRLTREFYKKG